MSEHLKNHVKALNSKLKRCPQCGGETRVASEPSESRFAAQCSNADCNHSFFYPVRASALSTFGILQFVGTIACAAGVYVSVAGSGWPTRIGVTLAGLLVGGVVIRCLLRLAAYAIANSKASLASKEDAIAYLAPPPFLKRECSKDTQPGGEQ